MNARLFTLFSIASMLLLIAIFVLFAMKMTQSKSSSTSTSTLHPSHHPQTSVEVTKTESTTCPDYRLIFGLTCALVLLQGITMYLGRESYSLKWSPGMFPSKNPTDSNTMAPQVENEDIGTDSFGA